MKRKKRSDLNGREIANKEVKSEEGKRQLR